MPWTVFGTKLVLQWIRKIRPRQDSDTVMSLVPVCCAVGKAHLAQWIMGKSVVADLGFLQAQDVDFTFSQ